MDFIDSWPDELARMNEGKAGKPFVYLIIPSDAFCCACLSAAIKQLEGFPRVLIKHVDCLDTPDYTNIAWRVTKMDIKIDPSIMKEDVIVIVADASGIKVANRENG